MSQLVNSADIELALHPSHPVTVSQEPPVSFIDAMAVNLFSIWFRKAIGANGSRVTLQYQIQDRLNRPEKCQV